MSGLFTVVVVMCASALICSLVQTFVTDGSTKKNHQPCFRRFYYLLYGCSRKKCRIVI